MVWAGRPGHTQPARLSPLVIVTRPGSIDLPLVHLIYR